MHKCINERKVGKTNETKFKDIYKLEKTIKIPKDKKNEKYIKLLLIILYAIIILLFEIIVFKKIKIKNIFNFIIGKNSKKQKTNKEAINYDVIMNSSNKYRQHPKYKMINTTEMNEYIINCLNGTLLIKPPKNLKNKIKITVIIPVYNAEKYIKSTLRSIQNQRMQEIEIILVDDCSTDNTLNIITKLQKEDKRIKLIKNQKNRGTLYSRSIAAINAKGKYIMTIDNDDMFTSDIFNICYEEAENDKLDIIEFAGCNKKINEYFENNYCDIDIYLNLYKGDGYIYKQPLLSNYIYQRSGYDYKLIDYYLWGKCIRTKLYKKVLKTIGKEIYTQKVCWSEDRIVNFELFRLANSFKYIRIVGIIHNNNPKSIGRTWIKENQTRVFHDELINIINMYNLTKNTEHAKFSALEFNNNWHYSKEGMNPENYELAKMIYIKLLNDTYISEDLKKIIIQNNNNTLN